MIFQLSAHEISSTTELFNKRLANDDDQSSWFADPEDKNARWQLDMEAAYQHSIIQLLFLTNDVYRYQK